MPKEKEPPKHKKLAILYKLVLLVAVLVIAVLVFLIFFKNNDRYKIPLSINKQLSFPVLFLKNPTTKFSLDTSSIKYSTEPDGSTNLNFVVDSSNNQTTISEQAYPDVLIYDKLTNSINPYSTVGTLYGEVTLGKPKDAGGKQTAVLNYGGTTLIFARPTSGLSDADWRSLLNSLSPVN